MQNIAVLVKFHLEQYCSRLENYIPYPPVVHHFVSIGLALMRSHYIGEFVLLQEVLCDIRSKVGSGTSQRIWATAFVVLWITPENVEDLQKMDIFWSISFTIFLIPDNKTLFTDSALPEEIIHLALHEMLIFLFTIYIPSSSIRNKTVKDIFLLSGKIV